ncbi:Prostamide/prostaglandin F synthase, partial [Clonorchis sinensis]
AFQRMVTSLAKLGSCIVQAALDASNSSSVESFWRDQTCVIAIFRRFGCKFCRLEALNLSQMKPAFDKRRIRLIGISFDGDGVKDFVDGNFFKGELFLDPDRSTYRAMDFKRVSGLSGFKSLFTKAGRDLNSAANAAHVSGNLSGDGWQTGGLLVVEKGGKVLYQFTQEKVVNHPDYTKIMEVLKIDPKEVEGLHVAGAASCGDGACSKP